MIKRVFSDMARTFMCVFGSLISNRNLVSQMVWRDILAKYKGSIFGSLWTIFVPILMLCVYTFVFSVVFKSRWAGGTGSKTEFATLMFTGLIIFNFFAESINKAPRLILDNPNYVKKVVFPLESLAWVAVLTSLFNATVSFFVLMVFQVILNGGLPWTFILTPILLIPLILFTIGITWFLAALGVFLRDVTQAIGIFTSMLMFLSPIFYSGDAMPGKFKIVMAMNPLAFYINQARYLIIFGKLTDLQTYCIHLVLGALIAIFGLVWFSKTRHAFADVM